LQLKIEGFKILGSRSPDSTYGVQHAKSGCSIQVRCMQLFYAKFTQMASKTFLSKIIALCQRICVFHFLVQFWGNLLNPPDRGTLHWIKGVCFITKNVHLCAFIIREIPNEKFWISCALVWWFLPILSDYQGRLCHIILRTFYFMAAFLNLSASDLSNRPPATGSTFRSSESTLKNGKFLLKQLRWPYFAHHTGTKMKLNPTCVYLESKGSVSTPSPRPLKW